MKNSFISITAAFLLMASSAFAGMSGMDGEALRKQAASGSANALSELNNAAKAGDSVAEFELGLLYDKGQGVPHGYAQAASWYRKAADQGDAAAQYKLGLRYANGQGVVQSNVIAYALFDVSATNDPLSNNNASRNREIAAGKMTMQEINAAQRLSADMMKPNNLLAALSHYEKHPRKKP